MGEFATIERHLRFDVHQNKTMRIERMLSRVVLSSLVLTGLVVACLAVVCVPALAEDTPEALRPPKGRRCDRGF